MSEDDLLQAAKKYILSTRSTIWGQAYYPHRPDELNSAAEWLVECMRGVMKEAGVSESLGGN